jgi:C1A family cysteine protease
MEGALAITNGTLISLSEQQLIDCTIDGCDGGIMNDAFEYASDRGACRETEYPYSGIENYCHLCKQRFVFSGCVDVTPEYEPHLKQAVATTPVSVAIDADSAVFQLYVSGIIGSNACDADLNHGVLIVGYGEEKGIAYWIVKNSWGSDWGERGFMKIERDTSKLGGEGACGIAIMPSYPIA